MADITILQAHRLSVEAARVAAQEVAERMARDFGVSHAWDGQVLKFSQSGVNGTLSLEQENMARLELSLGMMKAFAPMLREKLERKMAKVFTA